MALEIRHRSTGSGKPSQCGMTRAAVDKALLALPEAVPLLARLRAATPKEWPHREEHACLVACLVLRARRAGAAAAEARRK